VNLILVGFFSILSQVLLLRELNVATYGVELIYLLGLAVWLLGTAAGVLATRRPLPPSPARMSWLFLLLGLFLPLVAAFVRGARIIFGGVPGAYLPFPVQIAVLVLALLPASFLLGLLFQWAARLYVSGSRTLAMAYGIESVGGLAGGLTATLVLTFGLQNFWALVASSLLAVVAGLVGASGWRARTLKVSSILVMAVLFNILWQAEGFDRWMTRWNHPSLVETADSPYGRVTVTSLAGQVAVFENDALSFETEGTEAEELSHLAALQHPAPRNVLILGGGIAGSVREVLKHSVARIDYVELNSVLLEKAVLHLPADVQASLRAPGVHVIVADPRHFLAEAGSYDLILVGMPDPGSGQANRFYTREFFELCAARLQPEGILAFSISSSDNTVAPPLARRLASICHALQSVLPRIVVLWPGSTNIIVASRRELPLDPRVLIERLGARHVTARLVSPQFIEYLYTNDRFAQIDAILRLEGVPTNTDEDPVCYQYTLMIWLSKFFPALAVLDLSPLLRTDPLGSAAGWGLLLAVPAIFLASRFRPGVRRALLAGVAGFTGMVLETILILHYQVKNGVLFQDIGLLLMVFMAGLAAGAIAVDRLGRRRGRDAAGGSSRLWGFGLLVAFSGLCALSAFAIDRGTATTLAASSAALALAGFLVAAVFAHASLHQVEDQKAAISPLYAADLLGGCLGSLVGTLLLVPLLGLVVTGRWMAFLAAAALLLL